MDIAQESISIFSAVRSAERRSVELIAELDRHEAKVDASARQALIDERAYLVFFKQYAQQMLTWETILAAPPVGIPAWSNQKRQQFFDALETMQQQAATSCGMVEGMRAKVTRPDVRDVGLALVDSLAKLFAILEFHRQTGLEVEADADIEAGRVRKFGSVKSVIAFLSKKIDPK